MLIHGEWQIITYELHWKTHADNLKWRYGSPSKIFLLSDVIKTYEHCLVSLETLSENEVVLRK